MLWPAGQCLTSTGPGRLQEYWCQASSLRREEYLTIVARTVTVRMLHMSPIMTVIRQHQQTWGGKYLPCRTPPGPGTEEIFPGCVINTQEERRKSSNYFGPHNLRALTTIDTFRVAPGTFNNQVINDISDKNLCLTRKISRSPPKYIKILLMTWIRGPGLEPTQPRRLESCVLMLMCTDQFDGGSYGGKGGLDSFVWRCPTNKTTKPHRVEPDTGRLPHLPDISSGEEFELFCVQDRDGSDDQDMASDLRMARDHPFSFPHLGPLPGLPALEALNKQQKELLGSNIILPTSSPQGLLKAHSNLFPSHHGFPPLRPPSQVRVGGGGEWQNINLILIVLQPTPSSQSNSPSDFGTQQNWSFEEQFKQVKDSTIWHCKLYTGTTDKLPFNTLSLAAHMATRFLLSQTLSLRDTINKKAK